MIRATNIRNGLTCTVSAMSLGVLIVALAGCAGAEKQMYVDWIAVSNPDVVCAGKPDCVRRSTYKGKDLCTIITANKDVTTPVLASRYAVA
ncbi:MAG: hypothetical protein IPI73_23145 [Betaproteobacteria bacterium]|nr:hypothetical protein [Betaproteobacteria bacterium]